MSEQFSYKDYVSDDQFLVQYSAYQERYVREIRESDKVLLNQIGGLLSEQFRDREVNLLDIGCSTGNLLLHLKNVFPNLKLTGGDAAVKSIEECKNNPRLDGIRFEVMDATSLPMTQRFEIVIANAVLIYVRRSGVRKNNSKHC